MTNHENPHNVLNEPLNESLDEPQAADDRYAEFTTEDGLVVYDRDDETAWIESDTTVNPQELV